MTSTPTERLRVLARFCSSSVRPIDGPLVEPNPSREEIVTRMAAILVQYSAYANDDDAKLVLSVEGFSAFEIAVYLADARQAAMQEVVAREMSV